MTEKLKVLQIIFDGAIQSWEIPALRGAISAKVGEQSVLFHNHKETGYPLIQYKCIRNRPALVCIGEGLDEIHHFFSQQDWSVEISGRRLPMKILDISLNGYVMQVWDRGFEYQIQNWIALNQEAHRVFMGMKRPSDQIPFLEKKLTGNILSMAKGIGWYVDKPIETSITKLSEPFKVRVKGVGVLAFHARFRTNVFLPNGIGLGKNVSFGFGTVNELNTQNKGIVT
ncbi:MAG: CRISPR-associated endonuclease Cas6 [Bacteroidia bacterium]